MQFEVDCDHVQYENKVETIEGNPFVEYFG
jgi:hypothetical protein